MKPTSDSESGYVSDDELIATTSPAFVNVRIIRSSAMSTTASGERYGHRWFLKSIPPSGNTLPAVERLKKEFEILASMNHPGIVRGVSLENVDGLGLAIVMEWVEGKSLEDLVADNKLTAKERRQLAENIVGAVAYIHSMGIVHRDLKPSNIMVRKNGMAPVIVDFGLADTDSHTLLKKGGGTRGYMSPEAVQGEGADTRDDVYALGIILRTVVRGGMGGVIRRCLAPARSRYRDAERVREAMRRRLLIRKGMWMAGVTVVAVGTIGAMGFEMATLQRQRDEDVAALAALHDSIATVTARTLDGQKTVTLLEDSVKGMRARLEDAASQKRMEDERKMELDRVVENGVRIAEAIFKQFDRGNVETLKSQGVSSAEISSMLVSTVAESLERYLDGAKRTLPPEDFSAIHRRVWEREIIMYNEWQKTVLYDNGDDRTASE